MKSVIEYICLFFLSCIQSHYTADMQHHIKCDHRPQKAGHGSFVTAKRQTTNDAHVPCVVVKYNSNNLTYYSFSNYSDLLTSQ